MKNKVVIVTGSSSGIGKSIAHLFLQQGANVVISGVVQEDLDRTEKEWSAFSQQTLFVSCNVTKTEEIQEMVKQTIDKFGTIDVLVNNAGITKDGLFTQMSEADWDIVLNINLKGAFLVTKEVLPIMMKKRSGSIVNIASVIGVTGNAGQVNYSASKAGLIGFTKSLAKEYAIRNVRVNALAPGFIDTDMTKKLSDGVVQDILQRIPMKRMGTPEDIANAALFLASDMASYISGQVLVVDGAMI